MVGLPGRAPDLNAVEGLVGYEGRPGQPGRAVSLDQLEALIGGRLRAIQRQPTSSTHPSGNIGGVSAVADTVNTSSNPYPFWAIENLYTVADPAKQVHDFLAFLPGHLKSREQQAFVPCSVTLKNNELIKDCS
jgi:hypothetical protein